MATCGIPASRKANETTLVIPSHSRGRSSNASRRDRSWETSILEGTAACRYNRSADALRRDVLDVVDRTYAEETLARATAVLGDERADDEDREDAARVVQAILVQACPTEADLADLLSALGRALDVHLAIRRVLVEVQRLRPPQLVERAGHGVERLIGRAHRDGDHEALAELILVALEEPGWGRWLRDEWGKAAVTWAIDHVPERKYPAVLLVSGWVHAFGLVPGWMGEIADERPDLVTSAIVPRDTRWQLHHAAPSVRGWKSLASALGWTPVLEPALFGDRLDVAVDTLEQAIGETTAASQGFVLRRWLLELKGAQP